MRCLKPRSVQTVAWGVRFIFRIPFGGNVLSVAFQIIHFTC